MIDKNKHRFNELKQKFPLLRYRKRGKQKRWSDEEIKAGFECFYILNKRYPTAHEIDDFEYLPSSRAFQKRGGLPKMRASLGLLDNHLNKQGVKFVGIK